MPREREKEISKTSKHNKTRAKRGQCIQYNKVPWQGIQSEKNYFLVFVAPCEFLEFNGQKKMCQRNTILS